MSDVRTDALPTTLPSLPGYAIHAERSRDSLGTVYLARQILYSRESALRLVEDSAHSGLRDLTGVLRAARDAGRHTHPNLLSLYEAGENEGKLYLASDVPPGPSVREQLRSRPMKPEEAAALVGTVARAVAYLHELHALHLGLTAACVYLDDGGVPCVGDLGLAGLLHDRSGTYPGDRAYAAPEQLTGKKADARADVYALGGLLVECLTGHPPTGKLTLTGCPPALARICRKALQARPGARYSSAADLADDLDRFREGRAPAPGPLSRLVVAAQGLPALPLLVALVLVLLSAVGIVWWQANSLASARNEAETSRQEAQAASSDAQRAHEEARRAARRDLDKVVTDRTAVEEKARLTTVALESQKEETSREHKRYLESEKQYRIQSKLRTEAEAVAKSAGEDRKAALESRAASAREVERLLVAHGNALADAGDLTGALVPFTRALGVAAREKFPEEAHRLRIAGTLSRCPRPLCVVRFGKGEIAGVQLSPDGRHILVVGADGVVEVHDAGSGGILGKRVTHGAAVAQIAFTPDGGRVVSADAMGQVRMWNVEDNTPVFDTFALESMPIHLSFSGDGKRFVLLRPTRGVGGVVIEAQVFDAARGTTIGEAISEQVAALPAALSQDGSRLLVCGTDGSARVHDVQTGKQVGPALNHGSTLTFATFSADGRLVLTSGGKSARVWVTATGEPALQPLDHESANIPPQLDESGKRVLTVGAEDAVRISDTTTGKPVGPAPQLRTALRQAVLARDGRSVLLAGVDGTVRVFAVADGGSSCPLPHAGSPAHVALSPAGTRALTSAGGLVRVWDLTAGEPLSPPSLPVRTDVVYSPDGKRMARKLTDTVQLHDAATVATVGAAMKHKGEVTLVVFSPTGDRLLTVADPPEGATTPTWEVRVWDAGTGKPACEPLEHLRGVSQAGFVPGGTRVLTVSLDKRVRIWDGTTGEAVGKPMEHSEDVALAEPTPDGRRLVTTDAVNMTRAWDAATGERVGEGMGNVGRVLALVFSNDSKRLATCGEDGMVSIWDIETGKREMKAELSAAVTCAEFNADGTVVLAGCADGSARAWGVADGKARTPPLMHDQPVVRTAFSADGRWLLTASGRFVRLWDAQTGEAVSPPLPHAHETHPISRVEFSKTGELLTQTGPGTRWVRPLVADRRPPATLADLAVVISGREEVGLGQLAPAGGETFETVWKRVPAGDFSTPRARLLAWARRGAAECEAGRLWRGALRHLDVLIEEGPEPGLLARRAKVRTGLGQYEGALADFVRALEKEPEHAEWWAGRAEGAVGLKQWEAAAAAYTEALKRDDRNRDLWRQLGRVEAERARWKESSEALGKAARFGPADPVVGQEQALALLSSGDDKGYRQACERLVKRFGDRTDPASRAALADVCVLGRDAVGDYKSLLKVAEAAAGSDATEAQARLGALLLRSGEPVKAVTVLEKLAGTGKAGPAELWLLVLAQQKAGQKEKAKEWQEKAAAAKLKDDAGWMERQRVALWKREAEER
jgi:WD40 repeat protein/tetratricopeptide (TPR) repeat protein